MFKTALKTLLHHKLRMALTGFAIILGVSFVAGTYMFTDSISKTFDNLFSDLTAGIDVTVRPAKNDLGQSTTSFDESILDTVSQIEGVGIIEPEVFGIAQPLDKEGKPVGGQGAPSLGYSWTNEQSMNPLRVDEADGRPPEAPGEVVIDRATVDKYGFSLGDTITILFNGPEPKADFTLVGISTFGDAESLAGANLSSFVLSEAQKVFGYEGQYTAINIKAADNYDPNTLLSNVSEALPDELEAVSGEQQSNEQLDEINQNLGFINTALLVFAAISIFVGSFIIQNTFRIVVTQRTKELALLRALGATQSQIRRLVLYEAFFVGVVASVLGIFAGMLIAYGVRGAMNALGFTLPSGSLEVAPRTIAVSMLVGVGVTLLASLLPAIRASRLAPVAALRDNQAPVKRKALVKRGIIGTLMIIAGGAAIMLGLESGGSQTLAIVGMGVFVQFIGISVVAPLLAVPVSKVFGMVIVKLRGTPAKLALRNAIRSPRRTASTASALMIGVSLIAMIAILASSFKAAIDQIVGESFAADILVTSTNIGEAGPGSALFSYTAYEKLDALDELDEVSPVRYAFDGFRIENAESEFVLAGIEPLTFDSAVARLKPSDGAFEALQEGTVVVKQSELDRNAQFIGDEVKITYAQTGEQTYEIVGSFEDAFDSKYLISNDDFVTNFNTEDIIFIGATYNNDYSLEESKIAAENALSDFPQLAVQDQGDLKELANQQVDQIIALLWSLLAMAVIIAVFGITNTLMLSISERTKEIGMIRAIGMTRKQIRQMIRAEAIIIALFGALLGIIMGTFFAWVIVRALESEGINTYVFPTLQILLYFVFAIFAGVFAAIWPARKAARMDVLKAVYYE